VAFAGVPAGEKSFSAAFK